MPTLKLTPEIGGVEIAQGWYAAARSEGRTDSYAGKRQDTRYAWEAALEVYVTSPRGRSQTLGATARDVSQGGIGLKCRQAIEPFTRVVICLAGERVGVNAIVTHCAPVLSGHLIGARFDAGPASAATPSRASKAG